MQISRTFLRIKYHSEFAKHYNKKIAPSSKLVTQFKNRLELFIEDSKNPILKDHQLKGKRSEYRAFSITGDVRAVYKIVEDKLWLYDVGTHNQVY